MTRPPSFISFITLLVISWLVSTQAFWHERREYTVLEEEDLKVVAEALTPEISDAILDYHNPSSLLAKILIPRPVGSQNLTDVHNIIRNHFASLSTQASSDSGDFQTWEKFEDVFTDSTPYGEKEFTNLIFTHNPQASRKLVIAAHTDSKYFVGAPQNGFVGATDSAVPCAIMLAVASALTPLLDSAMTAAKASYGPGSNSGTTLQFVFLDGEEAFKQWTNTDSIYGARHLAEVWGEPTRSPSPTSPQRTAIAEISDFILLDLLGTANPIIRNFFQETGWLYDAMVDVEDRLGTAGYLWDQTQGDDWATASTTKTRSFFIKRRNTFETYAGRIEDDHLPFLARGVPILHVIPVPFPSVWHTLRDDASALDLPTVRAWSMIMRGLVAEYLQLGDVAGEAGRLTKRDELASTPAIAALKQAVTDILRSRTLAY